MGFEIVATLGSISIHGKLTPTAMSRNTQDHHSVRRVHIIQGFGPPSCMRDQSGGRSASLSVVLAQVPRGRGQQTGILLLEPLSGRGAVWAHSASTRARPCHSSTHCPWYLPTAMPLFPRAVP